MAEPDRVLKQAFTWYEASIVRAITASGLSPADQAAVTTLLWDALGLKNPAAPPANPDLVDFKEHNGAQESLAVAATIVGEALVALGYVQQAVAAAGGGGLPAALAVVDPVLQQIERLRKLDATARYPSALTIGKILLMMSGDAQANPAAAHEADKLASLLGANSAADIADTQAALGIVALLIGSLIDRTFTAPMSGASPLITGGLPSFAGKPTLTLKVPAAVAPSLSGSIEFDTTAPSAIKAGLTLAVDKSKPIDGTDIALKLTGSTNVSVLVPVAPPGPAQVSNPYIFGLELTRKKTGGALVISNDQAGVTISIGELGVALQLKNGEPLLRFSAHDAKATIKPSDGFLKMILGDGISVALDVVAEADKAGTLRFVNGTGLRVSLPIPTLPTGPFELQLINLGLNPAGGSFTNLEIEVSASFGVALGPFAASVDRLGIIATLKGGAAGRDVQFAFKPPNGIGLLLDAGIVKGGGYLAVDEQGYAGILELKMLAVDVKAICLLNTHSEAGFSLLLLIFGQFPPIQLSFGFTLTGVGGLIGVQHTASPPALSQALGAGNLDAVLFPENPVANAPQIINTLRAMFPVKRGGFIIGPMLELGWGTPSLVTVRMGLLVEADKFTLLGQAIVQVPPLVSADLALLYLRLDFVGCVTFDPVQHFVRREADSLARRADQHHRPVRLPRPLRRSADVPHQRRRLPSTFQGSAVRHSDAVRSRRRQPGHRDRRHRAEGLLRDHVGDDSGRRRAARLGRHRHRQHRGWVRLRRDLLSRTEVLLRAGRLRVSRRARVRHRLRVDSPRWTAGGTGTLAHCRQRQGPHAVAAA